MPNLPVSGQQDMLPVRGCNTVACEAPHVVLNDCATAWQALKLGWQALKLGCCPLY
jgi:hypothetical protein